MCVMNRGAKLFLECVIVRVLYTASVKVYLPDCFKSSCTNDRPIHRAIKEKLSCLDYSS